MLKSIKSASTYNPVKKLGVKIALDSVYGPVKPGLEAVETRLKKVLFSTPYPGLREINQYLMLTPGKRMRPALTLLAYHAFVAPSKKPTPDNSVVAIAAAFELIHMASLVHDDTIDHAPVRHNKPSVQAKWGSEVSITMGVYLYSVALKLISTAGNGDVLARISHTVRAMCEGELFQIMDRGNLDLSLNQYLLILKKKTGVLFGAAAQAGAILAGAGKKEQFALKNFGTYLGIVFQIVDDYLDIMGDESALKKVAGQDLEQGELTLPFIYLMEESGPDERPHLESLLRTGDAAALRILREKVQSGTAAEKTKALAMAYLAKARNQLTDLPPSLSKDKLIQLTDFVRERGF